MAGALLADEIVTRLDDNTSSDHVSSDHDVDHAHVSKERVGQIARRAKAPCMNVAASPADRRGVLQETDPCRKSAGVRIGV